MINLATKIATPVLDAIQAGRLQKTFRLELSPTWDGRSPRVGYLECFGRLVSGLAPWLELPDDQTGEGNLRRRIREGVLAGYTASVDPKSSDFMLWDHEHQVLVDAAYFANALIRSPKQLWAPLDEVTKHRIKECLRKTRSITPPQSNWLLFSAMIEAFFMSIGEEWDTMRIHSAIRKVNEWYIGDGWYTDGNVMHFNYYDSYVIVPMLIDILEVFSGNLKNSDAMAMDFSKVLDITYQRAQRYCEHLERMISPEGTFPPIGRSITYRTAVFQPLALLAWKKKLPASLSEAQVRCALTAVQKRIFDAPGTFNAAGFLQLGFAGHQPTMADSYSNSGSMYITSSSLLSLGLPEHDSYWASPDAPWTSQLAYSGMNVKNDAYHPVFAGPDVGWI